jgi:hypothetical protein
VSGQASERTRTTQKIAADYKGTEAGEKADDPSKGSGEPEEDP